MNECKEEEREEARGSGQFFLRIVQVSRCTEPRLPTTASLPASTLELPGHRVYRYGAYTYADRHTYV